MILNLFESLEGVSMPWTLRSEPKQFLSSVLDCTAMLQETAVISTATEGVLGVRVGGTCQNNFYMNAMTQDWPAENCKL